MPILKPIFKVKVNNTKNALDTRIQIELDFLREHGFPMPLDLERKERNLLGDKRYHDSNYAVSGCMSNWPTCKCQYAVYIRGTDLGFNYEQINRLLEVI